MISAVPPKKTKGSADMTWSLPWAAIWPLPGRPPCWRTVDRWRSSARTSVLARKTALPGSHWTGTSPITIWRSEKRPQTDPPAKTANGMAQAMPFSQKCAVGSSGPRRNLRGRFFLFLFIPPGRSCRPGRPGFRPDGGGTRTSSCPRSRGKCWRCRCYRPGYPPAAAWCR